MRQISPDKKTHLRLLQNARTFETKRKYISSETPLRFNPNVKAFLLGRNLQKNNVRSPGKLTGNCGRFFVYKIIRMLRSKYSANYRY